jgi:hypothetical protein
MFDKKKNQKKTVDGLNLPVGKYKDADKRATEMKLVGDYICALLEMGKIPDTLWNFKYFDYSPKIFSEDFKI